MKGNATYSICTYGYHRSVYLTCEALVFICCSNMTIAYNQEQEYSHSIRYQDHVFSFFHCKIIWEKRNICTLLAAQTIHDRSFWSIQIPQRSEASEFRTVTDLVTISKVTNIWNHFGHVQGGEGIPWHIPSRLSKSRGLMAFPCTGRWNYSLPFLSSQQALWTEGE
jgi:hypothetical protein